jgi:hypothetical protein
VKVRFSLKLNKRRLKSPLQKKIAPLRGKLKKQKAAKAAFIKNFLKEQRDYRPTVLD